MQSVGMRENEHMAFLFIRRLHLIRYLNKINKWLFNVDGNIFKVNQLNYLSNINEGDYIVVGFVDKDKKEHKIKGQIGSSILKVAKENDIDLEGACEESCACSTCHVYIDTKYRNKLKPPSEEEEDMLDLAPAVTSCSRLACQIKLSKELDGIVVTLPPISRNFYVDGHTPKH